MKFYLPTFDATVDTKAFPLAYKHLKVDPTSAPGSTKICDHPQCTVNPNVSEALRLPCFHTIHRVCYTQAGGRCPICTPLLHKIIEKISTSFNESLLEPTSQPSEPTSASDSDTIDDVEPCINAECDPAYYESAAWESEIDDTLSSFTVPQPSSALASSPAALLNVQVTRVHFGSSTFWFLPPQLSQSTLLGRNGSNACSLISLLMAKSYTSSVTHNLLDLNSDSSLSPSWISLILSSILTGNQTYDRATTGSGNPMFSVEDAKEQLSTVLGPVTLEEKLDLSITSTNPEVPQSSLAYYLQRLDSEPNVLAIVIMNSMTVCFGGHNSKIYIMDSHIHNAIGLQFGAMVGMSPTDRAEEFLTNLKLQLSPNFNVCSLTFASF